MKKDIAAFFSLQDTVWGRTVWGRATFCTKSIERSLGDVLFLVRSQYSQNDKKLTGFFRSVSFF